MSADIAEFKGKTIIFTNGFIFGNFSIFFVTQSVSDYFENSLSLALEKIKRLTDELNSSTQIRATQLEEISLLTLELHRSMWNRYTEDYEYFVYYTKRLTGNSNGLAFLS